MKIWKCRLSLATLCLFLFLNSSYSQEKKFKIAKNNISLHFPKNWQYAYNFLNTPLTLFGPMLKSRRAVISVNNTNIQNFSFDKKDLRENQNNYKKGRLKWLKKNSGKVVRFTGYRVTSWKKIKEIHSIGYSYTIGNDLFLEKAYFFNCNDELFNISTLMTWEQNKTYGKQVKKILSSFKCLKK